MFPINSATLLKRHDVPQTDYAVVSSSYLIDMPHEGHGVLIKPNWIVTVAHTIFYDYVGKELKIGNNSYIIENVIIHPENNKADKKLYEGDAQPLMEYSLSNHDIALIQLSTAVENLLPIEIYAGNQEKSKAATESPEID